MLGPIKPFVATTPLAVVWLYRRRFHRIVCDGRPESDNGLLHRYAGLQVDWKLTNWLQGEVQMRERETGTPGVKGLIELLANT